MSFSLLWQEVPNARDLAIELKCFLRLDSRIKNIWFLKILLWMSSLGRSSSLEWQTILKVCVELHPSVVCGKSSISPGFDCCQLICCWNGRNINNLWENVNVVSWNCGLVTEDHSNLGKLIWFGYIESVVICIIYFNRF